MFRRSSAVLASGTVLAAAYVFGKDEFLPPQLKHDYHDSKHYHTVSSLPSRASLLQKMK